MNRQTTKPHWILRTHDGVPVPPYWARGFQILCRDGRDPITNHINMWIRRWGIWGISSDIIAYRWIK